MLINLSNHPSSTWQPEQLKAAINRYETIKDITFPYIKPQADAASIQELAKNYFQEIVLYHPKAVHLMGEMTFTYGLVNLLKQSQITCLASTTNRIVIENGVEKFVRFQFVQFREYLTH